jgi:hypothetical protein
MSFIKISQLPSATGVTPDDFFVIVDNPDVSGITRKITAENLVDSLITEVDGGELL